MKTASEKRNQSRKATEAAATVGVTGTLAEQYLFEEAKLAHSKGYPIPFAPTAAYQKIAALLAATVSTGGALSATAYARQNTSSTPQQGTRQGTQSTRVAYAGSNALDTRGTKTREAQNILDYLTSADSDPRIAQGYQGYGITNERLLELTDLISTRMIQPDLDHVPGRKAKDLAEKIQSAVQEVVSQLPEKPNRVLSDRLLSQGVCDWVRTHVEASTQIEQMPREQRLKYYDTQVMLNMPVPLGICSSTSLMARNLSRLVGLECKYVSGYLRDWQQGVPAETNHGWVIFNLGGDVIVPSDCIRSRISLPEARRKNGSIRVYGSLPISADEFALFSSLHYGSEQKYVKYQDPQGVNLLTRLGESEWRGLNVSALKPYDDAAKRFLRR